MAFCSTARKASQLQQAMPVQGCRATCCLKEPTSLLLHTIKAVSINLHPNKLTFPLLTVQPSSQLREPTLLESLIPIFFLTAALFYNVFFVFGDAGLDGSNQLILIAATAVAGLVAMRTGITFEGMLRGMNDSVMSAMSSILILLLIGSLAGTWLLSGIVPAMIYYGLQILHPIIFLFAACLVSAIVAVATGSSWSTIATLGVAFLGIGKALGFDEGVVAGAIISGAYFGDKMSPLSDTTNLAPAVAGTDLFTHIRYMLYTTVPTFAVTLIIFLCIGFFRDDAAGAADVSAVLTELDAMFNINLLLFIVPVLVVALIVKKVAALPALLAGTLLGGIFALIFQPDIVLQVAAAADKSTGEQLYMGVMKSMYGSISLPSTDPVVADLLSTGGMAGMLGTIWLIISAMLFGGMMEATGMLQRITRVIIQGVHSTGSLIGSTAATCIFFNLTASDQYMAVVVPGKMFSKTFRDRKLAPENLSRTLEDSGTVTSVLIPWNTCGATQATVLGVATITYLPYCFFNILSPITTVIYGAFNIKIRELKEAKAAKEQPVVEVV